MSQILIIAIITFIHNLFTAIWIGGMIALLISVLPSIKKQLGHTPEAKQLTDEIKNRLSKIVYLSIFMLLITGLLLSNRSPLYQGPLNLSNDYSLMLNIKHLCYLAMLAIAVVRSKFLDKLVSMKSPKYKKVNGGLLVVNILIGSVVLFLSGYISLLLVK